MCLTPAHYWSASCDTSHKAWDVYFRDSELSIVNTYNCINGQSVRLVHSLH